MHPWFIGSFSNPGESFIPLQTSNIVLIQEFAEHILHLHTENLLLGYFNILTFAAPRPVVVGSWAFFNSLIVHGSLGLHKDNIVDLRSQSQ